MFQRRFSLERVWVALRVVRYQRTLANDMANDVFDIFVRLQYLLKGTQGHVHGCTPL